MADILSDSTKLRDAFRVAACRIERDVRLTQLTEDEIDVLVAAILQANALNVLPADIADRVLETGYVEPGLTPEHDAEGHGQHIMESCQLTAALFGQDRPMSMHGVYPRGKDTVLCHTGTSPNSPTNARALAGAWNWLVDIAKAGRS